MGVRSFFYFFFNGRYMYIVFIVLKYHFSFLFFSLVLGFAKWKSRYIARRSRRANKCSRRKCFHDNNKLTEFRHSTSNTSCSELFPGVSHMTLIMILSELHFQLILLYRYFLFYKKKFFCYLLYDSTTLICCPVLLSSFVQ